MKQKNILPAVLLITMLLAQFVPAQSLSSNEAILSSSVKVTIYRDFVRFAADDARQMRVELFELTGKQIFDSGLVSGDSFDWFTQDQQEQPVDSGLFAYTLTIKGKGRAENLTQQGNVIIDRERQNLPDAPSSETDKAKNGEIQPQTVGVFDVNAAGGSYNINTPRMGIGTANPQTRMHIGAGGIAPLTTGSTLLVEEGAASSVVVKSTTGGEMFFSQDNAAGVFGTASNHPLSIRTNNVNRVYIDAIGRVGIGTTTPTATLTVAGTIEATGGTLTGAVIDATNQYSINGSRVLSMDGNGNLFAGEGTATANRGSYNSFFGKRAGSANLSGDRNSFFGASTGLQNTTGRYNSFFGALSGFYNLTGSNNSFFGESSGYYNTTGSYNSFFGIGTGRFNDGGSYNAFFGANSGQENTANNNAFFGTFTGNSNTTGENNSFFGTLAGSLNTSGRANSFFGKDAGYSNSNGNYNSFFGERAGTANLSGGDNAFFGVAAGVSNLTGNSNAFFGTFSGYSNTTGNDNSFFGTGAGYYTTEGTHNTFVGKEAGMNNTRGSSNVFSGRSAGFNNTEGTSNSVYGAFAGFGNTTGNYNTFFGLNAGTNNTTGSNNTFIGSNTNAFAGNLSNATAIGARAQVLQSNSLVLGSINGVNGATADTRVGIGTTGPGSKLHIIDSGNTGLRVQNNAPGGTVASFGRFGDFRIDTFFVSGGRFTVTEAGNVGIGTNTPTSRLQVFGDVTISGNVSKGGGSFKIDHPLDPENKYLYHSFVESPDMMNIYNGNVTTDKRGLAIVTLPEYFEALNRDFRYQLTVIGQFAQAIVAREVKDKQFTIKTSTPNVKVSWQVTGIRQDAYANKHRIPVEEEKKGSERGTYLYPEAFNKSAPRIANQISRPSQQRKRARN
jgi:hypothetical protein